MIQAHHLAKRFGTAIAVEDVTLSVEKGQILALLGPNGAGKTTTVRMLASLLVPTTGQATIAGFDTVKDASQVRQMTGLLTELPGLYNRMSALDYLNFFGQLYGMTSARRTAQIEHFLKYFGTWDARRYPIGKYSKGMRQKVALARALLHDPQVILLDEPTSAMDPASAKSVRDYIRGLKEAGRTIVICTHNLGEAESLSDSIAIIKRGRIVAHGTSDELKRGLLGDPCFEVRFHKPVDPALFSLDGLLQIEAWDSTSLRYRTREPERANPAFVQHLVSAGAEVVSISQVPQSLEAVYLHLVGEELN